MKIPYWTLLLLSSIVLYIAGHVDDETDAGILVLVLIEHVILVAFVLLRYYGGFE